MNKEKKVEKEKSSKNEDKKLEVVAYDYADLSIYCHSCGKETPIPDERYRNIKGGITIPLMCNNANAISLSCGHCASILSLHFMPATNPPIEEEVKEEIKVEEKKDDIQKEDSKEQIV